MENANVRQAYMSYQMKKHVLHWHSKIALAQSSVANIAHNNLPISAFNVWTPSILILTVLANAPAYGHQFKHQIGKGFANFALFMDVHLAKLITLFFAIFAQIHRQ